MEGTSTITAWYAAFSTFVHFPVGAFAWVLGQPTRYRTSAEAVAANRNTASVSVKKRFIGFSLLG